MGREEQLGRVTEGEVWGTGAHTLKFSTGWHSFGVGNLALSVHLYTFPKQFLGR